MAPTPSPGRILTRSLSRNNQVQTVRRCVRRKGVISGAPRRGGVKLVSVVVGGDLTQRTAEDFCRLVVGRLDPPPPTLLLDLQQIKVADVVGLAAVRQAARLGAERRAKVTLAWSEP